MTLGRILTAAFAAILASSPALAQQLVPQGVEGGWETSLVNTDEGVFNTCMTTRGYDNGESVIFFSDGSSVVLGLLLKRWQLDERDSYGVSIQIDGGAPIATTALAGGDDESVLIDYDFTPDIDALENATTLTLITGAGPIDFDITGAKPALEAVFKCLGAHHPDLKP